MLTCKSHPHPLILTVYGEWDSYPFLAPSKPFLKNL